MRISTWRRWLAIAALALVTGCATSIATRTPDGRLSVQMPADSKDGYVLLKVVAIRPVSLLNPKWQQVTLLSADGQRHEVPDVSLFGNGLTWDSSAPTESLHFARLPPGDYEFASAGSVGPGPGLLLALIMSDHAVLERKVPRIRIEAGRLANLGTLVFAPATDEQKQAQMLLLAGPKGTADSLRTLMNDSADAPVPPSGGGWLQDSPAEPETIAQGRALVAMMATPTDPQRDGRLASGSHLGEFVERTGPGQWTALPMDALHRVRFATRWSDGTRVIGADFGHFAMQSPGGAWQVHRLAEERGRVVAITQLPEGQMLFLLQDPSHGMRALVQAPPGAGNAPARPLPVDLADRDETKLPALVLDHPEALLLARNIPGFRREVAITRIDKRTLDVTTRREDFFVLTWQTLSDGQIRVTRMNGITEYLTTSADGGKTWIRSEQTVPYGARWVDPQTGYAIKPSPGLTTVTNHVLRTTDGGTTWAPFGQPFKSQDFPARIVFADAQEIIAQGAIELFSSTDAGQTWSKTFPRRPPVAAAAQAAR